MPTEIESQAYMLLDVFVAAILGGLVGFEREWMKKPAGLRTNMIIAAASALFVSLGRIITTDYLQLSGQEPFGIDPTRIVHAVAVGIGFLGAGTILKSSKTNMVYYLTTSATIWISSALGIAVALKQYWLACGATLLILVVNRLFSYLVEIVRKRRGYPEEDFPKDE